MVILGTLKFLFQSGVMIESLAGPFYGRYRKIPHEYTYSDVIIGNSVEISVRVHEKA